MTRMNYEADRRRSLLSDCAVDDLPPTGSWADRRRHALEYEYIRTDRRSHCRPAVAPVRHGTELIAEFSRYVENAEHRDFARKPAVQKTDILVCIRKLLARPSVPGDNEIRARALKLIRLYAH